MKKHIWLLVILVVFGALIGAGIKALYVGEPVFVTSSGVWYRSGDNVLTNPPLPVVRGGTNATTTEAATLTLLASEMEGASFLDVFASTSAVTLTTAASSTFSSSFLPNAGDTLTLEIHNSSTTAGVTMTMAAGTGWVFRKASELSNLVVPANNVAVLNIRRESDTDLSATINIFD